MRHASKVGVVTMCVMLAGCSTPEGAPAVEAFAPSGPGAAPAAISPKLSFPAAPRASGRNVALTGVQKARAAGFPAAPSSGSIEWTSTHGAAADDLAFAVASDADSDVFVAGTLEGDTDLGCGPHPAEGRAAFVVKYDATGACAWVTYFDSSDDIAASALAFDAASGDLYVAGTYAGTASFGDVDVTSAGGYDGFVARLTGGAVTWASPFGGPSDEYVYALAVSGDRVAVGGAFYDTTSFGGASSATSQGDADAFVAALDVADGSYASSWTAGGESWDSVNALAPSASGFAVGGAFAASADLGAGLVASAGGQDAFAVVVDSSLAVVSARAMGGTDDDSANGVFVDGSGNVVVSGYFSGSADLGDASPTSGTGSTSGFVATYDASLAFVRATSLSSGDMVVGQALTPDPSTGGYVLAGRFSGDVAVCDAEYQSENGAASSFVAKYDANGVMTWGGIAGSGGLAETLAVAVAPSGNVIAAGDFETSIDFGGGAVTSAGQSDVFVMSLRQ